MKEKRFAEGLSLYKIFWIFLVGSVFGAYFEEILNLFIHYHYHHELVWQLRRGVFYGPISPIYGVAATIIILLLGRKERSSYKTILYGSLLGGSLEYLLSFLQETFLGSVSWDYTGQFLNINGRTTIPYALVWGLLSLLLIKVMYPMISNIIESFPLRFGKILSNTLIVILVLDCFVSWGSIARQSLRHNGISAYTFIGEFFDKYYPDEKIAEYTSNMVLIKVDK